MNCNDFEKDIILFTEIQTTQQENLKNHLANCSACAKLFNETMDAKNLVDKVANEAVVPSNSAKLTSDIMRRINSSSDLNWLQKVMHVLQGAFAKSVLASTSTILVISFSFEFFNDAPTLKAQKSLPVFAVLDSKLFKEKTAQQLSQPNAFAECTTPFKTHLFLMNCIKSKLK